MWLIAGLGNPGATYELTRHNVGFLVADKLQDSGRFASFKKNGAHSLVDKGYLAEQECVLLKPQTFMNLSGQSVAQTLKFYRIPLDKLIVIHDDLDLGFGVVRTKFSGGHGGHNGLRSIFECAGKDFWRVRVGIGRPPGQSDASSHVLGRYSATEFAELDGQIDEACEQVRKIMKRSLDEQKN